MRRRGRVMLGNAAFVIVATAVLLYAPWLPDLDLPEARRYAEVEVERMCRDDNLNCAPRREIQASDSGRVWLFIYAIPDARYGEVSAIVSKHWGSVELGRLPRD